MDPHEILNADGVIPNWETGYDQSPPKKIIQLYDDTFIMNNKTDAVQNECEKYQTGMWQYFSQVIFKCRAEMTFCCKVLEEMSEEMIDNRVVF